MAANSANAPDDTAGGPPADIPEAASAAARQSSPQASKGNAARGDSNKYVDTFRYSCNVMLLNDAYYTDLFRGFMSGHFVPIF